MNLLKKYLSLCWFKNNPIELFPSKSFMWKAVIFYLISGIIVESLIADPADGTLEVSLRTVMAFSSIATYLLVFKKWQYFNQMYTAIFICENFIMTLATITEGLYFWLVMKHYEYAEEVSIAIGVLLVGWYIAIVSYILRQAFLTKMSVSVILAFSYFILTYGLPMLFMDI
ncbi:MAG: hypothetical protein D0528_12075 [Methylococcales bacterium]|nr:MAG: hypothetical protein D0528_12075 [Methylococcales bacterium]